MRKHWRKLLTASLIVGNLFLMPAVDAEVKLYTATSEDYASEIESQEVAKLRARDKAIRNATEQAGVYLKAYSRTVNFELTDDEITVIASNSYELVGEVQYSRVVKQITDETSIIVWRATVNVNVDDAEVRNWTKRDADDRSKFISQTRDTNAIADENDRKVEDLRKRAETASTDAERAQLKAEFDAADNEFLSNQKVEEGTRLAYEGKHDDAIKLYTEAIDLKPDNAAAYNWRGAIRHSKAIIKIYNDKNNSEGEKLRVQALDDLNRAIQLKPDYSEAYSNRGFLNYMAKNYPASIKDFNSAVEFNPNYAQNYIYRSLYWRQIAKDNARGLADLNKAIELDPNNAHFYSNRATFYKYDMKDYASALEDYTRAIELEKDESNLSLRYFSRAALYKDMNSFEKAIADYTQAIELSAQSDSVKVLVPWMYRGRAECYEALGDTANAQADMNKYRELERKKNS